MAKNAHKNWLFEFTLMRQDDEPFTIQKPAELMSVVISWAENNNMMVGGGMRPVRFCGTCKLYELRRKSDRGTCKHSDYRASDDTECEFFQK